MPQDVNAGMESGPKFFDPDSSAMDDYADAVGRVSDAVDKAAAQTGVAWDKFNSMSDANDRLDASGKRTKKTLDKQFLLATSGAVTFKAHVDVLTRKMERLLKNSKKPIMDPQQLKRAIKGAKALNDNPPDWTKAKEGVGILGSLGNQFRKGAADAHGFTKGMGLQVVGFAALAAGAVLLTRKLADMFNQLKDGVVIFAKWRHEMAIAAKTSLIAPKGLQQLHAMRESLGMTRKQFEEYADTLKKGTNSGLISINRLHASAKSLQETFGGDPRKRLEEFISLLEQIPTLETDLNITASLDDQAAAWFAIAEQGKVEQVLELQTAGLLGGERAKAGGEKDIELQNAAMRADKRLEDIHATMLSYFPAWGMTLGSVSSGILKVAGVAMAGVAAIGGLAFFMKSGNVKQTVALRQDRFVRDRLLKAIALKSGVSKRTVLRDRRPRASDFFGKGTNNLDKAFKGVLDSRFVKGVKSLGAPLLKLGSRVLGAAVPLLKLSGVAFGSVMAIKGLQHSLQGVGAFFGSEIMVAGKKVKEFSPWIASTGKALENWGNGIEEGWNIVVGSLSRGVGKAVSGLGDIFRSNEYIKAREEEEDQTIREIRVRRQLIATVKRNQQSALVLQSHMKALGSISNSAALKMYDFQKSVADAAIDLGSQMGGSLASFSAQVDQAGDALSSRFGKMNSMLEQRRKAIMKDAQLTGNMRRVALMKLHHIELDAAKAFVTGMISLAGQYDKIPGVALNKILSQIEKVRMNVRIESESMSADEIADNLNRQFNNVMGNLSMSAQAFAKDVARSGDTRKTVEAENKKRLSAVNDSIKRMEASGGDRGFIAQFKKATGGLKEGAPIDQAALAQIGKPIENQLDQLTKQQSAAQVVTGRLAELKNVMEDVAKSGKAKDVAVVKQREARTEYHRTSDFMTQSDIDTRKAGEEANKRLDRASAGKQLRWMQDQQGRSDTPKGKAEMAEWARKARGEQPREGDAHASLKYESLKKRIERESAAPGLALSGANVDVGIAKASHQKNIEKQKQIYVDMQEAMLGKDSNLNAIQKKQVRGITDVMKNQNTIMKLYTGFAAAEGKKNAGLSQQINKLQEQESLIKEVLRQQNGANAAAKILAEATKTYYDNIGEAVRVMQSAIDYIGKSSERIHAGRIESLLKEQSDAAFMFGNGMQNVEAQMANSVDYIKAAAHEGANLNEQILMWGNVANNMGAAWNKVTTDTQKIIDDFGKEFGKVVDTKTLAALKKAVGEYQTATKSGDKKGATKAAGGMDMVLKKIREAGAGMTDEEKGKLEAAIVKILTASGQTALDAQKAAKGMLSKMGDRAAHNALDMQNRILASLQALFDIPGNVMKDLRIRAADAAAERASAESEVGSETLNWGALAESTSRGIAATIERTTVGIKLLDEQLANIPALMEKQVQKTADEITTLEGNIKRDKARFAAAKGDPKEQEKIGKEVKTGEQALRNARKLQELQKNGTATQMAIDKNRLDKAKKELEMKKQVVEQAKRELDSKNEMLDAEQQTVDEMAGFIEDIGGNVSTLVALQLKGIDLEAQKLDNLRTTYDRILAASEELRKREESGVKLSKEERKDQGIYARDLKLMELKITRQSIALQRKAIGAQRNAYEKLLAMALGDIRGSRGARKHMTSVERFVGRGRAFGRSGMPMRGKALKFDENVAGRQLAAGGSASARLAGTTPSRMGYEAWRGGKGFNAGQRMGVGNVTGPQAGAGTSAGAGAGMTGPKGTSGGGTANEATSFVNSQFIKATFISAVFSGSAKGAAAIRTATASTGSAAAAAKGTDAAKTSPAEKAAAAKKAAEAPKSLPVVPGRGGRRGEIKAKAKTTSTPAPSTGVDPKAIAPRNETHSARNLRIKREKLKAIFDKYNKDKKGGKNVGNRRRVPGSVPVTPEDMHGRVAKKMSFDEETRENSMAAMDERVGYKQVVGDELAEKHAFRGYGGTAATKGTPARVAQEGVQPAKGVSRGNAQLSSGAKGAKGTEGPGNTGMGKGKIDIGIEITSVDKVFAAKVVKIVQTDPELSSSIVTGMA